jgi:hypothetical protein
MTDDNLLNKRRAMTDDNLAYHGLKKGCLKKWTPKFQEEQRGTNCFSWCRGLGVDGRGRGDHWQIISGTDVSILKRGESARIPSVSFAVSLCIDRGGGEENKVDWWWKGSVKASTKRHCSRCSDCRGLEGEGQQWWAVHMGSNKRDGLYGECFFTNKKVVSFGKPKKKLNEYGTERLATKLLTWLKRTEQTERN